MTKNRIAVLLTLMVAVCLAPRAIAADKPNVLFIAIDDLNDWVGPLSEGLGGHSKAITPVMDKLAARGVTFTNAHCQSPLCNPSRTSVLIGLRPTTTGVYALNPWFRSIEKFADHVTLPQHFMRHGYHVMTTGKIYHDAYPPAEGREPNTEFSIYGFKGGFAPRPEQPFVTGTGHPLVDWGVYPETDEAQDDWKVADWAIDALKDRPKDKPFMLCVGIRHPHVPLYTSQQWFDLYPTGEQLMPPIVEDDRDDTPRSSWYLHWRLPEPRLKWVRDHGEWKNKVRAYLASVSFADAMVGRVLDALDAEGLADDTLVVLWSDHGYHLGEKEITGKNTLWRESTRVPLIFAGPGVQQRGATCNQPAELLDLYPTLVELCGLPPQDGLEGRSLAPQLADISTKRDAPAICTHGPENHAVITTRWRYIRYNDGSEELYNLQADPREWNNLADDPRHAETKAQLATHLPESAPPAPNAKVRLIEIIDGLPHWEGQPIQTDDSIPAHIR